MDDRVLAAAANNAAWCATVCDTYGIASARSDNWWVAAASVPTYFPDAVTLRSGPSDLPDLLAERSPCSIKDSFGTLDLERFGFRVLFDAGWIWRESSTQVDLPSGWSVVTTADQLRRWQDAHGDCPALRPELLDHPEVRVLVADSWTSGLIASSAASVVGISNVFGAAGAWSDGVAAARQCFPGLPLVGWERDNGLAAATASGFQTIGQLRVWRR
jgi:hypothetical protein